MAHRLDMMLRRLARPAQIGVGTGTAASVGATFSDVQGGYAGSNINTDPQFTDLDGPDGIAGTADDIPKPVSGSPVNDAGSSPNAVAILLDMDGLPRFADDPARANTGVGPVPVVDMGAYEWNPPPPCAADFNGNGTLEVADIFAFLNAWFAGSPAANFDGINGLQVADIFAFLNAWFAGCQ